MLPLSLVYTKPDVRKKASSYYLLYGGRIVTLSRQEELCAGHLLDQYVGHLSILHLVDL